MNISELFALDINNKNTLLGGAYGVAHALISLAALWGSYLASSNYWLSLISGFMVVAYYFWKENIKGDKYILFPVWRGLDSFLDWTMPLFCYLFSCLILSVIS